MITIIIFAMILVLSVVIRIVFHKEVRKEFVLDISTGIGIAVGTIITIIFSIGVFMSKLDNESIIYRHQAFKELLDTQRSEDHSAFERMQITKDILEMNKTISTHKVYSKSLWTDLWYSEEVGNLPYLK